MRSVFFCFRIVQFAVTYSYVYTKFAPLNVVASQPLPVELVNTNLSSKNISFMLWVVCAWDSSFGFECRWRTYEEWCVHGWGGPVKRDENVNWQESFINNGVDVMLCINISLYCKLHRLTWTWPILLLTHIAYSQFWINFESPRQLPVQQSASNSYNYILR